MEHDSHGQLIYGVMESFRFTRDRAFLKEMWPHVRKAARYLEKLRALRLTPEYQNAGKDRALRIASRVGEPRGLPGASGPFVLG